MATTAKQSVEAARRAQLVADAQHSLKMEGIEIPEDARRDSREYIEGMITTDQMLDRARRRVAREP
jgi:Antitoxin VbhA